MRKYFNKQTIVAFLLGAVLFSAIPVKAAIEEFILYKADYKLVINGVEFNDPDVPLMNYKGYTVGSVRKILEAAGIPITWNAKLGQAEVTSNPTSVKFNIEEENTVTATTTITIECDPVTGLPVGAEYKDSEKDGREYKTISYNDKTYISDPDLLKIYKISYVTDGTFKNKSTGNTATVDLKSDTFWIGTIMYTDISKLTEILGE
jgi:hypothetical protein